MSVIALQKACHRFEHQIAPYTHIRTQTEYEAALVVVEELMTAGLDDATHVAVDLIGQAIAAYEVRADDVRQFVEQADDLPGDIALLRVLMDQHQLGVNDLPEIGSKSMVSRVLSGERQLNKSHITKLSARFAISPALFFA